MNKVLITLLTAVLLSLGCGGSGQDTTVEGGELAPGHRKMLELLDRVADESEAKNPYLRIPEASQARESLSLLPEGVPDLRRWLFNMRLGKHELRMGNSLLAIEHYENAHRELVGFADEIPPEEQLRTIYELAVAHLRRGETDNCVRRHTSDSCIFPIRGDGVHGLIEGSQAAIVYLDEVLERARALGNVLYFVKARWLVNIAYMTLGRYPEGVPAAHLIPPAVFDSDEPMQRFRDVAPQLGLNSFDLAGGAVADDFNGDGWLDLFTSSSDTRGQLRFYVNEGDGTFTERTEEAGLSGLWGGLNLVQADYDNDGDVDLLVLRGAWWRQVGDHPNSLVRNQGDGTFVDVTFEAGLGERHYPTQTAAWADYDNDGDLDLYIGNEFDPNTDAPCQLFRNEGDGTFTDVAEQAGVTNNRYAKAVVWGDYDGDRFPDLFVSNMGHENRLYHNNGDGTFTDVAEQAGVTRPVASFPSWFWDFDNDGALDLLVTAYGGNRMAPDVASVAASYLDIPNRAELDHLYRGDGKGGFVDVAASFGLTRVTLPMGVNIGDLDNDGFLDFYLGTGYPYYEGLMPNLMFRNRRGTGFSDVTTAGGFGHLQKGHGVVFADLDHDGDQDVFEQMGGFYPGDAFGNALFENPGFGNHWIKIQLVGVRSNRLGVGARIRVDLVEDGVARSVYRHVGTGGTFGGNSHRQEIGLGRATRIDRLTVDWPTSDTTQTFTDLLVDRLIEINEGDSTVRELPHRAFALGGRRASGVRR